MEKRGGNTARRLERRTAPRSALIKPKACVRRRLAAAARWLAQAGFEECSLAERGAKEPCVLEVGFREPLKPTDQLGNRPLRDQLDQRVEVFAWDSTRFELCDSLVRERTLKGSREIERRAWRFGKLVEGLAEAVGELT